MGTWQQNPITHSQWKINMDYPQMSYNDVATTATKVITDSMSENDRSQVDAATLNEVVSMSNGYFAAILNGGIKYASSSEEADGHIRSHATPILHRSQATTAKMKTPITLVLVTGGRDYADVGTVFDCLAKLNSQFERMIIIHGDADGADTLANTVCKELGIEQVRVPAAWNKYKRAAGPIRNKLMLDLFPTLDLVMAFPGGTGTADMKTQSAKLEIPILTPETLLTE